MVLHPEFGQCEPSEWPAAAHIWPMFQPKFGQRIPPSGSQQLTFEPIFRPKIGHGDHAKWHRRFECEIGCIQVLLLDGQFKSFVRFLATISSLFGSIMSYPIWHGSHLVEVLIADIRMFKKDGLGNILHDVAVGLMFRCHILFMFCPLDPGGAYAFAIAAVTCIMS